MKRLMHCFDAMAAESSNTSVLSVQVINDGSSGVLNKDVSLSQNSVYELCPDNELQRNLECRAL